MANPGYKDFKLLAGNTRQLVFYPKDTAGELIDITGMRVVFFIGTSIDDYLLRVASDDGSGKCVIGADGKSITITISKDDSRLLPKGGSKFELELRDEDDLEQQTLVYGLALNKIWINDDAH